MAGTFLFGPVAARASTTVRRSFRAASAVLVLALAGVLALEPGAHAQALSPDETARLHRGEIVERPAATDEGGRHYVGGTVYALVEESPARLDALLRDAAAYRQILPNTSEARLIGVDHGDLLLFLRQGTALFHTSYTVRLRELPAQHEVQFWLDRTRPHGIEDAHGYLRYTADPEEPFGPRLLVVYGIDVDLGPGIVRTLFEHTIQRIVLTVPARLRAYVAARRPGG